MTVSGTNFGNAAADYGEFRAGFPDSLFDRLRAFDVGRPRQTIVDLGTGTGTLARGFALRGCTVFGIDPDARMLEQAKALDYKHGAFATYVEGTAEATGLDVGIADVVSAGQCWHWFDRPRALVEVQRLLKPGGSLVIAYLDWMPHAGNVVEATERLIEQHNPQWNLGGGLGLYPQWLPDLSVSGFRDIETFSYDIDIPYKHDAWRGRIRACAGVTALDDEAVQRFDAELRDMLAVRYSVEPLAVPHRVFAIVATAPAGA